MNLITPKLPDTIGLIEKIRKKIAEIFNRGPSLTFKKIAEMTGKNRGTVAATGNVLHCQILPLND